jgi:hypothetical protein
MSYITKHKVIIIYRILDKEARKLYIIMEYCENGDMA